MPVEPPAKLGGTDLPSQGIHMPPIEPPSELTTVTRPITTNLRTQRPTDLPDPEPFRPVASPVDLNPGSNAGKSQMATLQGINNILGSASGALQSGALLFGQVRNAEQEKGSNQIGLATSEAEAIENASDEATKRQLRGGNPFVRQGRQEQMGENLFIRSAAAFEQALITENQNRAKRGEPLLQEPDDVVAWAERYFREELGDASPEGDPHFERGFTEGLQPELVNILQNQEVLRRERVADEAQEAADQLTRETLAAVIDDSTGSVDPGLISNRLSDSIFTRSVVEAIPEDELTSRPIQAMRVDLIDRVRRCQWQDLTPRVLDEIESNFRSLAGADTDNRARLSDAVQDVEAAIDRAQADAAKADEASEDLATADLQRKIQLAVFERRDQDARVLATSLSAVTGDPGAANTFLTETRELAENVGGEPATEEAREAVEAYIDLNGPTVPELHRYISTVEQATGTTFTRDEKQTFAIEQNQNQNRGRVRRDPTFKVHRQELTDLIRQAGGSVDPLGFVLRDGDFDSEEAKAFREILRAFDQRVVAAARALGGVESIKSDPAWAKTVRQEADAATSRISSVANAADTPNGTSRSGKLRLFTDRLEKEQRERDREDGLLMDEIRTSPDLRMREERIESLRAVQELRKVERIMEAFPQASETESPWLDPRAALGMHGVTDGPGTAGAVIRDLNAFREEREARRPQENRQEPLPGVPEGGFVPLAERPQ